MSRVDSETLKEIATLSAAINRHKLGLPPAPTASSDHSHAYHYQRGSGRGRGARGRSSHYGAPRGGRGAANTPYAPRASVHRSLVLNNKVTANPAKPEVTPSTSAASVASTTDDMAMPEASTSQSTTAPAKTDDETEEGEIYEDEATKAANAAAAAAVVTAATRKTKKNVLRPSATPFKPSRHRTLVMNGSAAAPKPGIQPRAGREVDINGVKFVSDATGRKLVRKDLSTASPSTSALSSTETTTPSKASVGGQAYVRTKSGNLISADLVKKRELEAKRKRLDSLVGIVRGVQKVRSKSSTSTIATVPAKPKTLCRYFQKTGKCTRGLTCPYVHDSDKVSVCPRFIKKSCPYPASACPLSHIPDPHRMPHCQHFPYCTKGTACPYTHVHVAESAKVCKDFVTLGWCEKGLDCKERHVWECPEFSEQGKCSKRGCKLPHVIRRKAATTEVNSALDGEKGKAVVPTDQAMPSGKAANEEVSAPSASGSVVLSRKRSHSASISEDEGDSDASNSVDTEMVQQELITGYRKKKKTADAMQANEDFVTLLVSDTETDGTDGDDADEVASDVESIGDDDVEDEEDSEEGLGDETAVQQEVPLLDPVIETGQKPSAPTASSEESSQEDGEGH